MTSSQPKRTALVTGAASGIGSAIAIELAAGGAFVLLLVRAAGQAKSIVQEIEDNGGQARELICDLAEPDWPSFGEVDVLVHNAAAHASYRRLPESDDAERELTLRIALNAGMRLAKAVLPGMEERGFGRIVYVGSKAAGLGAAGQVAYATAKAGMVGMARSIAVEFGRCGVTCNVVEPGLIATPRIEGAVKPKVQTAIAASSALGRMGTAGEVAALVGFLASERASFITGAVVPVDGGLGLGVVPPLSDGGSPS